MKIWVCRDEDGEYSLYEAACNPIFTDFDFFECECDRDLHRITDCLCDGEFKKHTGLKNHLRVGTKKLMTWTLPLARQPKGKK